MIIANKMPPIVEGLCKKPKSYTADAGYGSEENYTALEERDIEAFVKYPLWCQKVSGELKKRSLDEKTGPMTRTKNAISALMDGNYVTKKQ